jgi:hypothetical protein
MEALAEIEALAAIEDRWAGREGERRAAEHLVARLRSLGRDCELEPAVVRPDYPLTYVLHILLALAGDDGHERGDGFSRRGMALSKLSVKDLRRDAYGRVAGPAPEASGSVRCVPFPAPGTPHASQVEGGT